MTVAFQGDAFQVDAFQAGTLHYHAILEAMFAEDTQRFNRIYAIGRDSDGAYVYGTDKSQAEINLVGERLDFYLDLSIPSTSEAGDVAEVIQEKQRLSQASGYIVIPPNCGAEIWDVITVTDAGCAQDQQAYRIVGYRFDYEPRRKLYEHKLLLGAP